MPPEQNPPSESVSVLSQGTSPHPTTGLLPVGLCNTATNDDLDEYNILAPPPLEILSAALVCDDVS